MKKFTIEVKGASAGQLQTIASELKIMSNDWAKHGPRITINGKPLEAPSLTMEAPGPKLQAASLKKNTKVFKTLQDAIDYNAKKRS